MNCFLGRDRAGVWSGDGRIYKAAKVTETDDARRTGAGKRQASNPPERTDVKIETYLKRQFRGGDLEVLLPGGRRLVAGDGEPPHVGVKIADNLTLARIMAQPSLGVGEAYMAGRLQVTRGSIRELVELAMRGGAPNIAAHRPGPLRREWARWTRERNVRRSARRNVHHHYDLSVELYRAFLDADLQYSCAYFETPQMIWTKPRRRRSGTSPASWLWRPVSACWTSAAAGAEWLYRSPPGAARRSMA